MDKIIQNAVAIAAEYVQGESPDSTVVKIILQEVVRKLKKVADTAKGLPIDHPPADAKESRAKFWASIEPSVDGYSKALDFLLNNIPPTLVVALTDEFAG